MRGFYLGQLAARWVILGLSEKKNMFQTYHAAPDDEAAVRMASALRASSSAL